MTRFISLALLVCMLLVSVLAVPTLAQSGCPAGYSATTLAQSGVPNLFRLGIKNGVSWTRIVRPSGAAPVPERVFPNETLCVPTSAATVVNPPANQTVIVVVVTPTPLTASESAFVFQERVNAYCAGVPRNGLPADYGSCITEAREVVAGNALVIQENISCKVDAASVVNGTPVTCSKLGTKWLRFR